MTFDHIPFVDLQSQYKNIKPEIISKLDEVLESRAFIQGKFVEEFENAFSKLLGAKFAVGCSSGTSALSLSLEALGIGPGDEVITSAHTFIATGEAITHVGAVPVFTDIDPETYTINPKLIRDAVSEKTRAILPVHIYGNPCKMDEIMEVAREYDLYVVEDCAQAHLAKYKGVCVGTFGDTGTFSFYPGKNLGAYGDAGCVITQNERYALRLKKLRDHGRLNKYEHDIIGYNHRMDGIQAGVLQVKLDYIEQWTRKRKKKAQYYSSLLNDLNIKVVKHFNCSDPVYHLYVIELADRDKVMTNLKRKNIDTGIHYPVPLHLQKAFSYLNYYENSLPHTETAAKRILSLPMYPEITREQIDYICTAIGNSI